MTLILRYAARSDRGLIRDLNQDSVYAGPRLLAVADGMGGMAAGDVASHIVIGAIAPLDEDVPGDNLIDTLRSAVVNANQQIRAVVDANPRLEGMGTTLTGILFAGSKLALIHIGDSRGYMMRNGEFTQITKDDTYVQMLIDEGRITPEEANTHPQRSLITKALDGRESEPDFSVRPVETGDRYLICSDGLSGVVSADTIAQTMREYVDPQQCMERLIALALRGGGPDNISVIIADATDEDIVEQAPIVDGAAAVDRPTPTPPPVESTPAQRAAVLTAPRPAEPAAAAAEPASPKPAAPKRARRHPIRTVLILVVLLGTLSGLLWGAWSYSQSRYYIGVTEAGQIAVFRGVPGQIAGFDLSEVQEVSNVRLEELTPVAQEQVRRGIQADSLGDARDRLLVLIRDDPSNTNLLPVCAPTPSPTPSVDPTATPEVAETPSTQPSDLVVPSPVPCRSK